MKTRNGFVSNSSSSSFLVALPKGIDSIQELNELLFKYRETITCPYDDEQTFSRDQLSEVILSDLRKDRTKNKTDSQETIISDLSSRYFGNDYYGFSQDPPFNYEGDKKIGNINKEADELFSKAYKEQDKEKSNALKDKANALYRSVEKISREFAVKDYQQFVNNNKDKEICLFSFSDNEGDLQSLLEHGDTFRAIPHITMSHH